MLENSLEELQRVLVAEYSQSRGMFTELAHIESLLAETYRERVQYELLQNSDDAGATAVNITIGPDGAVEWTNNGRPFDLADAEALCRSASSTKTRGNSIGYRGIGFKSLAAVASHITVASANWRFSFDREETSKLLRVSGHEVRPGDVPLIRIPTQVMYGSEFPGATFNIIPLESDSSQILGMIDPLALLFLRHVRTLTVVQADKLDRFELEENSGRVQLRWNGRTAEFATLTAGRSFVAIPLDESAISLVTLRGHLACFLPLHDQIGAPLVVSGDLLTDPSRSHAIVSDPTTQEVLSDAARAVARQLSDPTSTWFQRGWELLTLAEDPRSVLASGSEATDSVFLRYLREHLNGPMLPFAVSPIPLDGNDIAKVFDSGAPVALYRSENLSAARALRAAFGLPAMDVARKIGHASGELSPETIASAKQHVQNLVTALGRRPNDDERRLIGDRLEAVVANPLAPPVPAAQSIDDQRIEFPEIVAKWRTAELAVLHWLNSRGWQLTDVSKQNLGYDLVGLDLDGNRIMIEIKRVERPDARFAMTNNEMGAMQSEDGRYVLGIVIGDGRYSRLMFLDPTDKTVPRERVCRAWEWQFTDWSKRGRYLA